MALLSASIAAAPASTQEQTAPVPAAPAEPPKRRGRPKGSKNVPKGTQPEQGAEGGLFLYFDCAPVGVATQSLGEYVDTLDALFSEKAQIKPLSTDADGSGVYDVRSVSSQDFGFGKWKGFFAKLAAERPPADGHYLVTRGDERVEVVAEALTAIAALVVRG